MGSWILRIEGGDGKRDGDDGMDIVIERGMFRVEKEGERTTRR